MEKCEFRGRNRAGKGGVHRLGVHVDVIVRKQGTAKEVE
jgi:hypothetical protein